MKIDFSAIITDLAGVPLPGEPVDRKKPDGPFKDFTLRTAAVTALSAELPDDKLIGEEKYKRYRLADKIYGCAEPIELKAEQISLLKTLIAKTYQGTLIPGRCWDLLDPQTGEKGD